MADVMIGIVVTNERCWLPVRRTIADYGYTVSPDDCYLALRGFRTIGVRMKHQMQSALTIARWLKTRPEVKRVLYPALEDDPGYAIWKRDFKGASGLFGVVLRAVSREALAAFFNGLVLFGRGYSWGGYESLIVPAHIHRSAKEFSVEGPLLRFHAGLENPDDLIAELDTAFARLREKSD